MMVIVKPHLTYSNTAGISQQLGTSSHHLLRDNLTADMRVQTDLGKYSRDLRPVQPNPKCRGSWRCRPPCQATFWKRIPCLFGARNPASFGTAASGKLLSMWKWYLLQRPFRVEPGSRIPGHQSSGCRALPRSRLGPP